nr:unnamed protein product [Callosobruchus chinensis]
MEKREEKIKGRFIEQQRMKSHAGKAYLNRNKIEICPKNPPNQQDYIWSVNTHLALSYVFGFQVQCKCYYDCKKIAYERKLQLFQNFYAENYKTQGTYLMGLIHLTSTRKVCTAVNSKRQTSVTYTIPNQDGHFVQVCRNTFMNIFDVTQKRLVGLIQKKKMGDTTFTDKRSNNKPSKFTNEDRQLIHQHINSIPRDDSHYSRAKSDNQFLSPDLNIQRLYKLELPRIVIWPNTEYSATLSAEAPNIRSPNIRHKTHASRTCKE